MEPGPEGVTSAIGERLPIVYCDTSALARAYLADEPGHDALRGRLLEGDEQVVTSTLAEVELVAALAAAGRAGRIADTRSALAKLARDVHGDGAILLLALDEPRVLPQACDLCARHRLRAIDAIHLAVALSDATTLADGQPVVFVTRDADQAAAAVAEGLPLG